MPLPTETCVSRLDKREQNSNAGVPVAGTSLVTPTASAALTTAMKVFDAPEPFQPVLDNSIPNLELGRVADELLADDWHDSSLLMAHLKGQGGTEIAVGPWIGRGDLTSVGDTC